MTLRGAGGESFGSIFAYIAKPLRRDGRLTVNRAASYGIAFHGELVMEHLSLKEMQGGWIVGDFDPCVIRTSEFEVAIKEYPAGAIEPAHHHKLAEEVTVVAAGKVRMMNQVFAAGSIVRLAPGESTAFEAIEPTITIVVKRPSVPGDKYLD